MKMIVGLIVLILLAVGAWWWMGGNATAPAGDAAMESTMEGDAAMGDQGAAAAAAVDGAVEVQAVQ